MTARRLRGRRVRGGTVVLTPRDHDILSFVGLCGYVSSEQVARELFPSPDRARRRLRHLYDAQYVDVILASSTMPNLVRLTRDGLAALREHAPDVGARVKLHGTINAAGVAHHLAIVDVRTYTAALTAAEGATIRWSDAGGTLHQELALAAHRLVPDALCEFGSMNQSVVAGDDGRDGAVRIGVEVDCGTEGAAVLEEKFEKYAEVFDRQLLDELWLLNASDDGAAVAGGERLAQIVARAGLGEVTRVLAHGHVRQRPVEPPPARVGERGGGGASRAPGPR